MIANPAKKALNLDLNMNPGLDWGITDGNVMGIRCENMRQEARTGLHIYYYLLCIEWTNLLVLGQMQCLLYVSWNPFLLIPTASWLFQSLQLSNCEVM